MLAGFEQAFGTVEWPFIGEACAKWIKNIYTDIPSAVINNVHLSYLFLLDGVRQLIIYLLGFVSGSIFVSLPTREQSQMTSVLSRLISVKHTKRSSRI
jgi:hypothetical protein